MQLSLLSNPTRLRFMPYAGVVCLFFLCVLSRPAYAQDDILNPLSFSKQLAQSLSQQLNFPKPIRVETLRLELYDQQAHQHLLLLSDYYLQYLNQQANLAQLQARLLQYYQHHEDHWSSIEQIYPQIKSRSWVLQQQKKGIALFYQVLNDDLYKVFKFDRRGQYLTQTDLPQLLLEPASLNYYAMKNLKQHFLSQGHLEAIDTRSEEKVYLYKLDDHYDASGLLLLPEALPHELQLEGKLLAFVPSRGVLLLVSSEAPQALALARHLAQQAYANFNDAISPYAYQRHLQQWQRHKLSGL